MNSLENKPMPWCNWCRCYHYKTAECISKELWALWMPGGQVLAFRSKAAALRHGHARKEYVKLLVKPTKWCS